MLKRWFNLFKLTLLKLRSRFSRVQYSPELLSLFERYIIDGGKSFTPQEYELFQEIYWHAGDIIPIPDSFLAQALSNLKRQNTIFAHVTTRLLNPPSALLEYEPLDSEEVMTLTDMKLVGTTFSFETLLPSAYRDKTGWYIYWLGCFALAFNDFINEVWWRGYQMDEDGQPIIKGLQQQPHIKEPSNGEEGGFFWGDKRAILTESIMKQVVLHTATFKPQMICNAKTIDEIFHVRHMLAFPIVSNSVMQLPAAGNMPIAWGRLMDTLITFSPRIYVHRKVVYDLGVEKALKFTVFIKYQQQFTSPTSFKVLRMPSTVEFVTQDDELTDILLADTDKTQGT